MIKPEQLTAYDAASGIIDRAANLLESINVARLDSVDSKRLADLILLARSLRSLLFSEAHDRFLRDRGLKPCLHEDKPECACRNCDRAHGCGCERCAYSE